MTDQPKQDRPFATVFYALFGTPAEKVEAQRQLDRDDARRELESLLS